MDVAFSKKRVRFELHLHILDLNNVPLVSGTSFIKWHLPHSTSAEHRGRTEKCSIRDHRVAYDHQRTIPIRLAVAKDGMLQECRIDLEVLQEYSAAGRNERIRLGYVRVNLAEYVEASSDVSATSPGGSTSAALPDSQSIVRRYLMQESKINSTLKLGIYMKYVDGPREYHAPPLRTAPVFGGIAGIMQSSEPASGIPGITGTANGDPVDQDVDPVPSLSASNRELGELQDMYRRTLAAFWTSQPGELKADECIEDIFAGGDGWGKAALSDRTPTNNGNTGEHQGTGGVTSGSGTATPDGDLRGPKSSVSMTLGDNGNDGNQSRSILDRNLRKGSRDIDEIHVRSDMRSWRVQVAAVSST